MPWSPECIEGGKDQIGFIAQEVQATPLGERVCKTKERS